MDKDLQSILALGVVVITALAFLIRYFLNRRSSACSGGCGCDFSKKAPNKANQ